MISVLTPTYKLMFRDRQIEALSKQTFKDFEWIIVDDNHKQNQGIKTPFPLIHIPPAQELPYCALAQAMNEGLLHATGKYVFFMNDYVVPEPTCLQRHWDIQEKMGGCLLSGECLFMDSVPAECRDKRGKIITRDWRMGMLEEKAYPSTDIGDGLYEITREGIQNWWAGRNDSAPLEALLNCNGFDEVYDGRWGGHDAEMANRLMTYGLKYYIDKKSRCLEYDHLRANKKAVRTEEQQQAFQETIINRKVKHKIYTANTDWLIMLPRNIREERCQKASE